jgi:outer membrane cobalamin receptor
MIIWTDADGDFVYRPDYLERATVSGWEAQALYRVSDSIAIPVGYQRLSTRDEETGERPPGAVKSLWRAAIQGTGTSLTWSLEYAATNREDVLPGDGFVNATTINAALAWRDTIASVPVRLSLRAENLQDRDYETVAGYPMRGLCWFAELKVGL